MTRTPGSKKLLLVLFFLAVALPWTFSADGDDPSQELLEAARKGDTAKVKQLLDQGVDVNSKSKYGTTALSFASGRGYTEIVQILLAKGADVNAKDTFYGATPLDFAIQDNHLDVVKLLLEKGANAGDALVGEAEGENYELVQVILGNSKIPPETLSQALAVATEKKNQKMIDLLSKAGAKPADQSTLVEVDAETLRSYEGSYTSEGNDLKIERSDHGINLLMVGQDPIPLLAQDSTNFKPMGGMGFTIEFQKDGANVTGFKLKRDNGRTSDYKKAVASAANETPSPQSQPQTIASKPAKPSKKNWPSFRGWNASGIADGQNPPVEWNAEKSENILWKTEIPGLAHSSPVIWEDRVFITSAISSDPNAALRHGLFGDVTPDKDVSKHSWRVYCLDRKSGNILWEKIAVEGVPDVKRHPKSTQANSTPATDGKHLVVLFNTGDFQCYDLNGKLLWKENLGKLNAGWFYDPDYEWGFGSSPIIYKDLVLVQCDLQKNSFIAAYDVQTGKRVWSTNRDEIPSWGTPTIYESANRVMLVANGTNAVRGYDPMSGKELWKLTGNAEITVPTPIYSGDLIYVTSGYSPIQPIYAIKADATGDITLAKDTETNSFIAWSKLRGGPYLPTPIVYGDYLYTCGNNGVVTCYNAKTGERVYQQRLGGKGSSYAFTASPVAADGKIYFTSEDGEIFVVKAGPQFELLSTNEMGEVCLATPAIADGMLIVRAQNHVFGIGKKE